METEAGKRWALAALLGGATGIAFAPILVRGSEVGPSATAFYRLLFALPVLWSWELLRQDPPAREPVRGRRFWLLALAGLCFTGDLAVWHWSLQFTSVANSTLLTNFTPVFVVLGARLFFAERVEKVFVLGLGLALTGAVLLVGARFEPRHFFGDALAFTTAIFYAGYQLTVKHLRRTFSTVTIMAWSGVVACPALGLIAACSGEQLTAGHIHGWLVLLGLALVSHLGGQTLIAFALGHLPAAFSSVGLLLQPVIAAGLAWILLNERLIWPQVLGGLVVLAGLILARRGNKEA